LTLIAVPSLQYVSDDEPGIRRRRAGRGFVYVDAGGRRVDDAVTVARIRALAIPPAWTDVWISPDPAGHIQATGRDARGRKQYRYHDEWREFRDRVKFDHLLEFGALLPRVRRQVDRDMAGADVSRDRVVATIVRLLELSLIRVGNEEYARDNGSYGLTTFRNRHARVHPNHLEFVFRGKSGKEHRTRVADRRVARAVKRLQELPGQLLFQYVGEDGAICPIGSADVNDYLREVARADVTAKEYRTWMGTVLAARALAALPAPITVTEMRSGLKEVLGAVSRDLGNTPAVCRASYVHPRVIEAYEDGTLPERWNAVDARGSRVLTADERRLLAFLRTRPRGSARATARAA
jgi:DNA topoisomerase-1